MLLPSPALCALLPLVLAAAYVLWTFLALLLRQARSPLRHLAGPPSRSFFLGNLREMHDAENTGLVARWEAAHGSTFVYRGFLGGCRLMTTDPVAVAHILGRGYDYPKPDFVRDALASMAAGHEGLLVVEGEDHRRQRKILSPAFASSHIKSLSPIFWRKAVELRDIWLDIIRADGAGAGARPAAPPDPFAPPPDPPSTKTTGFLPNPFAAFVSSKRHRRAPPPSPPPPQEAETRGEEVEGARTDVLAWLARATLDVIGLAGFGHAFDALGCHASEGAEARAPAPDTGRGAKTGEKQQERKKQGEDELARAFAVIFSTARRFRVVTILQVWFPVLRRFRRNSAAEDAARATMRRIGGALIDERRRELLAGHAVPTDGRDLLTVMLQSSMRADPAQQLSHSEMLCQISTFLAAGHETSSSALAWTLYALARAPAAQATLRAELRALALPETPDAAALGAVLRLPYLDAVVREALRLHAPVTSTMRVAARGDRVPVSAPYRDARGRLRAHIELARGDIVTVPLQAVNRARALWGADAGAFRPERWLGGGAAGAADARGLWGGLLTFGSGAAAAADGNRSCIGYRFALNEMKLFLCVLVRDVEFALEPGVEIEKRVNVVTRPCVKAEPHMGNQMPLRLRAAQ